MKIIERGPGDLPDNRYEVMFRTYLQHWKDVEQPIDPRVIAAVRRSRTDCKANNRRTQHHDELLAKVDDENTQANDAGQPRK